MKLKISDIMSEQQEIPLTSLGTEQTFVIMQLDMPSMFLSHFMVGMRIVCDQKSRHRDPCGENP